ncbi:MAG: adenylyltransferase/cytidyltransferase family protein, partial [bacterium]
MLSTDRFLVRFASIGGTFDAFHSGHQDYIRVAFDYAHHVLIYVTANSLVRNTKDYDVLPYQERVARVQEFVNELGYTNRAEIRPLNTFADLKYDFIENKDISPKISLAIVVPEYYRFFRGINRQRMKRGLPCIHLLVKERSRNGDNIELSSSAIRNGQVKDTENCTTGTPTA